MSLRQTYVAWRISNVTALEKIVLLALADYADDNGENIYPKIVTLAEKTCQSERTVQRCLKSLEEKNYVHIMRGNGKEHSTYFLTLPLYLLAQYDATKRKRKPPKHAMPLAESNGTGVFEEEEFIPLFPDE